MVSTNSKIGKAKQKNSFEKLDENNSLKAEDMRWLIDNLPVTVFRSSSNLSWGLDYISSSVEKLTGYSKKDFIDQRIIWPDIVFPQDVTTVEEGIKAAKKNSSPYQIEYRIKKADGSTAFIQEKAHVVFDGKGEPSYIAGVFSDISAEVKQKTDSQGSIREEETIQLEMFRSFIGKVSKGEEIEQINGDFTGETKKTVELINLSIGNIMGVLGEIETISKAGKEGQLSIRANDSKYPGGWGMLLRELNGALDSIISPLNVAAEYVERISRGDIPYLITDNYKGDFNEIKNNLNICITAVNNLIEDSLMLSGAGVAGRLDTRADPTRHEGDFRKIVEGVNNTLDAVIGPLNVAAEYVERISRGDIPQKITDNYNGDFNEIKNNLNNCIDGLQGLVECNNMLHHMAMNDHSKGVEGKYVGIFDTMCKSANEVRDRLLNVTKLMNEIAVGDTSQLMEFKKVGKRCEQDHLLPAMIQAMENINLLIEDTRMLSKAAVEGKLDNRADASKHKGEYRKIVEGVNATLDAVIGPLNVAAEYVERISRGDIPKPITDKYNGDFNEIKNNLNTCIAAVNLLIEDSLMLSEAGVAGRLDTRADASRHEGDFRKIVAGVNDTLDAVIGPLNVAAEYVERISRGDIPQKITDNYNGDFNEIKNSLNNCIEGLQGMVECNFVLHRMAMNDHSRGVEGEYIGVYKSMAESTNEVRDRLLKVTKQLNEIAVGDTSQLEGLKKVGKRCEQDHLLPAVIEVMENINHLLEDTGMLTREALAGKLDFRADESKHKGEYRNVIQGINNTLDAVVCPLNTAADLIERISRGDIPEKITDECYGDFRAIKNNLNACINAIHNLIEDSLMLSAAGIEGRLDTRADVSRHQGDFRRIVEGVNATLDAVIGPLNVSAEYVERISRGDVPQKITDNYNGDFNEIKNNLNNCIEGLQGLVECNSVLQRMAINDNTKGVEGQYVGIYASMGKATNNVRDRILNVTNQLNNIAVGDTSPLEGLKKIGKRSEQDELLPAIIRAMENVNLLIEDTGMLSKAAVEGRLDTRADASRHHGEYRKIVKGVNDTLDAVIGPVNEAIKISNEFSNGNFKARVDESLHVEGDFINFKNVLNNIGISVSDVIKSVSSVTLNVVTSTDEASRGADEVAKAAGNVADSSQKSSELTRELRNKIDGINREIVDLSKSNENIANTSKGILAAADEVVRIGKDAQTLGRDTNLKMESVEKIARESVIGITSLTEQIKQIDGIVHLINDITSQINLLSLNAAIEAARAGEHGRGFAVVAGEVKNLATKARNATETIENVVNSVQRDSKKTADAINTANVEIIDGVNSVNKTLDALNTIIKNATQVTNDISDITKAIEKQATISLNVVKASEEGNIMTEEVQREAESLAAVSEETSASIQEIGASIHEIANLSNKLKSEMEVFKV